MSYWYFFKIEKFKNKNIAETGEEKACSSLFFKLFEKRVVKFFSPVRETFGFVVGGPTKLFYSVVTDSGESNFFLSYFQ
jgi:hypothetical protein